MRILILLFALISTQAQADLRVVTDIPAVHSLASQVMGDTGAPTLLIDAASDPHHFQLRPSQARALSNADILIWVGANLTPWLEASRTALAPDAVSLDLINSKETLRLGDDPHVWLDPENALLWLGEIARALGAQDPGNADVYNHNAQIARHEIAMLVQDINATLSLSKSHTILTEHDSLAYFAKQFDITIAGTVTDFDGATPSAARLKQLQTVLAETNITCALHDPAQNPDILNALIKNTGIPTATTPLPPKPGTDYYGTRLRDLASTISNCRD